MGVLLDRQEVRTQRERERRRDPLAVQVAVQERLVRKGAQCSQARCVSFCVNWMWIRMTRGKLVLWQLLVARCIATNGAISY